MAQKTAVIIGAGPAGLTAAYELLSRTDVKPIILEKSEYMGGISRTVNYKGNRIDIGGHRFFSKSDRVMDWWLKILPMQAYESAEHQLQYQGMVRDVPTAPTSAPDPTKEDNVMLLRNRRSRLYYMRKFFDYPISLSVDTVMKLGLFRMFKIGCSYMTSMVFPIRPESNLEEFFINRFGKQLYLTFFKSYTEKVWGVPCNEISAAWGAQRIKGLSIKKVLTHALDKLRPKKTDIRQKDTETSLIERFLYPKFGPGQMWEEVARQVTANGAQLRTNMEVVRLLVKDKQITGVEARDVTTGKTELFEGDYFFSTMPVKELVRDLETDVPPDVKEISEGLLYRDFITVGLLVDRLKIHEDTKNGKKLITDNWIYIQEPDVLIGRLQIFNNWSPYMVSDPSKVWLGLEYFCSDTDDVWSFADEKMIALGKKELAQIGIIEEGVVQDACVIRMPKTYPGYFGSYDRFDTLQAWLDKFENLFLVGRNGMHKYNNQDHSMLTAMVAVDNIAAGITSKENIWAVNTEAEYHEESNGKPTAENAQAKTPTEPQTVGSSAS